MYVSLHLFIVGPSSADISDLPSSSSQTTDEQYSTTNNIPISPTLTAVGATVCIYYNQIYSIENEQFICIRL